ncbi:toxin-antitoxin system YwqK family antitoxin [Flavobacterium sp.]|uniref:toxin-antitoxin system YwqK family antitoxin n=1 Tax=Flavobacterium sp. TaxID=239 RepID=UPI003D10BF2B
MKKIVLLVAVLITGSLTAQTIEPKFEIEGNLVKATYYYDNGMVKETGYYNDGKVDGKWYSYKEDGTLKMSGEYKKGIKTGQWSVTEENDLKKIAFLNNKIQSVNSQLTHHKK